jgi:hypothetical protein
MSIPDHARANFATLLRAAADDNLALMECADAVTGEARYVICAVGCDGTDFVFTAFGHLADGNPFDAYVPRQPRRTSRLRDQSRGWRTRGEGRGVTRGRVPPGRV